MAKFGPFKNGYLVVNGVDLSDHLKSLTINEGADMLDESCMGDSTKVNRAGIINWSINAGFIQDFAAGSVDPTLSPLVGAAKFLIVARVENGAASATNPQWSGYSVLESYQPIAGSHGEELQAPATFQSAGALTRSTS